MGGRSSRRHKSAVSSPAIALGDAGIMGTPVMVKAAVGVPLSETWRSPPCSWRLASTSAPPRALSAVIADGVIICALNKRNQM